MSAAKARNRVIQLEEADWELDETSSFYKRHVIPVDRGWAWVICWAGFLAYFSLGLANQALAVLFIELVDYYNTTIIITSLMFTFSIFAVGFMSIFSTNIIIPRIGERTVVSIAGICASLGSLGLSFAPNIGIFILFTIVKGFSAGAIFVPSISLIRHYFYKRRSIAQIIANIGQSVAVIVAPPMVRVVRKEYGISGTFMILAGIELHITVAGLLLRPVSAYRFRPVLNQLVEDEAAVTDAAMIHDDYFEYKVENEKKKSSRINKRFVVLKKDMNNNSSIKKDREVTKEEDEIREVKRESESDNTEALSKTTVASQNQHLSFATEVKALKIPGEESEEMQNARKWTLRFLLLSTIPGAANLHLRNYIPTITESLGADLDQSAILQTIVGSVDLLSRLCVGLFADLHILTSVQIIIVTQIALGTICHIVIYFTTFEGLTVWAVLIGLFVGTRVSMLPLVVMEVVGIDKMPQALSIVSTVGAVTTALMNPALGAVAEHNGDFIMVMHIVGSCFYLSSTVLLAMPIFIEIYLPKKSGRKKIRMPPEIFAQELAWQVGNTESAPRNSSIVLNRIGLADEDNISIQESIPSPHRESLLIRIRHSKSSQRENLSARDRSSNMHVCKGILKSQQKENINGSEVD